MKAFRALDFQLNNDLKQGLKEGDKLGWEIKFDKSKKTLLVQKYLIASPFPSCLHKMFPSLGYVLGIATYVESRTSISTCSDLDRDHRRPHLCSKERGTWKKVR